MSKYGVAAKLVWDGTDEVRIPSEMGMPAGNQMRGTPIERLSEVSGRVCYDSLGRGRSSEEFHKHILEVKHLSVYGHGAVTVRIQGDDHINLIAFLNRPGVWVDIAEDGRSYRVTFNPRALLDWEYWTSLQTNITQRRLSNWAIRLLMAQMSPLCPMVLGVYKDESELFQKGALDCSSVVDPVSDEEKWISLFLSASRGFCYDSETEVLTEGGWKKWPDVSGVEKFATLNTETGHLEYQLSTAIIKEKYSGSMYKLKSKMVDLLVTPNHRMYVHKHDTQAAKRKEEPWAFYEASEIAGKRVNYKRDAIWVGDQEISFTIPDVEVRPSIANQTGVCKGEKVVVCAGKSVSRLIFSEFIGWWLSEGHLDHSDGGGYSTVISQNIDSRYWNDIIHCIESLGFTYRVKHAGLDPKLRQIHINGGKALYDFLSPYKGSLYKAIPDVMKNWDSDCHLALIKAHLAGDGSFSKGSLGEANTVSRQLADDLQEAALKAGWSASIRSVDRRDSPSRMLNGNVINHNHILYVVTYSDRKSRPLVNHGWQRRGKKDDSWVQYDGMIYCATVPNGTLYVRRNGRSVWSGNSHEMVRHGFRSGISQRSTRYVDEDGSPWLDHPLVQEYLASAPDEDSCYAELADLVTKTKKVAKATYKCVADELQRWLLKRGVDKFSSRKQARGAARGYLGNALVTELVFSASVAQWKRILRQRLNDAADAEIRAVSASALPELQRSRYSDCFQDFRLVPSTDGIGHSSVEEKPTVAGPSDGGGL